MSQTNSVQSSTQPIDIHEVFARKNIIPEPPETSILKNLVSIVSEPAIVLFGPTKGGKTRLAAWEATALATKLNRRVLFILTEPNIEDEDIADILSICAYHNVSCELHRLDHLSGIRYFTERMLKDVERAMKKSEDTSNYARVVVVDSVTGISNLVISGLSESLIESGAPTTLPYVYPWVIRILDPLRRVLSKTYLNGYLIMTAQETGLRGETYVPGLQIKSKPKYAGAAQYYEDLEVYVGLPKNMPDSLQTCNETKTDKTEYRPLIVAYSRRNPQSIGMGLAFKFVRYDPDVAITQKRSRRKRKEEQEQQQEAGQQEQQLIVYGRIETSQSMGTLIVKFIPKDMLADESLATPIVVRPLIPVVGCGPKKV